MRGRDDQLDEAYLALTKVESGATTGRIVLSLNAMR